MFCPNCGNEIEAGAQVCPACNKPVGVVAVPVPGAPAQTTSSLAIASLVLGILGVCSYGVLGIAGIILGIMAIKEINRSPETLTGKGLAIGGIASGAATLAWGLIAVLGIAAAIAIPNFLKYQVKARQNEAKKNLNAIFIAQAAYYTENGSYSKTFGDMGYRPEGDTRYSYFLSGDEVIRAVTGGPHDLPEEVEAFVKDRSFQAVAVGNVDNDDFLDVWTIDENKWLENPLNDVREH